ncbi:hypothetical protein QBC42DRAFT_301731 [Cladorrhinum samala]|uniref:C2H2-type domain-containing protein n=1 Tax=Cladorrhinum samala TaxID=585594 RepID=A0AAV9H7N4_9PEZI|nr:hypothetical protein QBC42DRAFT_301731 [Cladorrhinum samala]
MTGQVLSKPISKGKRAAAQDLPRNKNNGKRARTEPTPPADRSLLPCRLEQTSQSSELLLLSSSSAAAAVATTTRTWACPFSLHPVQGHFYTKPCRAKKIGRFSDLLGHFGREHIAPVFCPRCGTVFGGKNKTAAFERHQRQEVDCRPHPSGAQPHDGFVSKGELERVLDRKKKKIAAGLEAETEWFRYWSRIFPDDPPPVSPYHHETADEERLRKALPQAIESMLEGYLMSDEGKLDAEAVARIRQYCRSKQVAPGIASSRPRPEPTQFPPLIGNTSFRSRSASRGTGDRTAPNLQSRPAQRQQAQLLYSQTDGYFSLEGTDHDPLDGFIDHMSSLDADAAMSHSQLVEQEPGELELFDFHGYLKEGEDMEAEFLFSPEPPPGGGSDSG